MKLFNNNAKKSKLTNKISLSIIDVMVILVIAILVLLLGYILVTGLPHVSWNFLTSQSKPFGAGGGIADELFNSFYILIITLIISFPISLGAAIYLSEYAKDNWLTEVVQTSLEVLSSLPSIVIGLFGYLVFVIKFQLNYSIISGSIALMFVNLPILTRNTEQALEMVPELQREAGLSLGLSEWKTITGIILPTAIPGIITGIILSAGRIFGEAAALLYTAGQSAPPLNYLDWNPFSENSFLNPMRPAETLAVHIWKVNNDGLTPDAGQISSGSSAVLIIIILIFILLSRYIGNVIYNKMTGDK